MVERLYAIHKLHANYGRVFSEWSAKEKEMGDGLQVFPHQFLLCVYVVAMLMGPCHHGMARPQVADRGTASNKEGSCE